MATAGTVAYNTAKSGLLGLMRTLAVEWAADGIRVDAVLGGFFFRTEMTRVLEADPTGRELVARAPMGRWGSHPGGPCPTGRDERRRPPYCCHATMATPARSVGRSWVGRSWRA